MSRRCARRAADLFTHCALQEVLGGAGMGGETAFKSEVRDLQVPAQHDAASC